MKKKLLIILGTVAIFAATLGLSLPTILHGLGLHPSYEGETYDLDENVPGAAGHFIQESQGEEMAKLLVDFMSSAA